jgi:hypothetical protein
MGVRSGFFSKALLAGLFALAMVSAPAEHARAVLGRAVFVATYAMPDGTLPDLCAHEGGTVGEHGQHVVGPACLACVIMAAPGMADRTPAVPFRSATWARLEFHAGSVVGGRETAWAPQRARAPPREFIA